MLPGKPTEYWLSQIAIAIPRLAALIEDHRDFNEGLIPHVLFGEIAPWVEEEYRLSGRSKDLGTLLDILDQGYDEGDSSFQNVLEASFIENVGPDSPLIEFLGPALSTVARRMFGGT